MAPAREMPGERQLSKNIHDILYCRSVLIKFSLHLYRWYKVSLIDQPREKPAICLTHMTHTHTHSASYPFASLSPSPSAAHSLSPSNATAHSLSVDLFRFYPSATAWPTHVTHSEIVKKQWAAENAPVRGGWKVRQMIDSRDTRGEI